MKNKRNKYQANKGIKEVVWSYILGYVTDHNYSPTLEEIASAMKEYTGFTYTRERARQIVNLLVKDEKLEIVKKKWRGIRIAKPRSYARA